MADPALTSHSDAETLTESAVTFIWSAGDDIDWYKLAVSWTQVFTLADDTTTTQEWALDSGTLSASRLSHEFNLPADGQSMTVTLSWSSAGTPGSASYTITAVDQPGYQDSTLYFRDDCPVWYQCDRCGFVYPEDEMTHDPYTGLWVCLRFDYDHVVPSLFDPIVTMRGKRRNPYLEQ